MSETFVLYHGNCMDGYCAVWVARNALSGREVEFIPAQYGEPPPAVEPGSQVYVLDFSYKREVMLEWLEAVKPSLFVLLDHHATAEKELAHLDAYLQRNGLVDDVRIVFDMEKSGARLTWEYFHNKSSPWLVDYTEDRDLWAWKLPYSREISAWLYSHPQEFNLWSGFSRISPGSGTFTEFVREGAAILRYQQQVIDAHVKNASEITLDGHKVLCANATVLHSEIGAALAVGRPFGCTFFDDKTNKRIWSLRSTDDGVDVSEVAKKHGGGGHLRAAGFQQIAFRGD